MSLSLLFSLHLYLYISDYLFNSLADKQIGFSRLFEPKLFLILIVITFMTGILSGSYPALFLSSFKPASVLKGEIISGGQSQAVLRKTLVVVQFSLTLFLIIGSTIANRQLKYVREKDLGMDTSNIIITEAYFRDYQSAKSIFLSNPDILSMTISDPPNI